MAPNVEIYVGDDGILKLVEFCRATSREPYTVVADVNTQRAVGERVVAALKEAGLQVTSIVLQSGEVIADEKHLLQVMIQAPAGDQTFVAVGSGTLTDITRYVSFRSGNPFVSVPSAASVDGFLSTGAPLVIGGVKETYKTHAPIGVFADLPTLVDAPPELRAAGFGDVVGKSTSLADWRLGQMFWGEPYDPEIDERVRHALINCMESVEHIAAGSEAGLRHLIDALLETGMCMLEVGNSRPASGSEHHCSHFWEMKLLEQNKPAILHGAKVGYASTLIAGLYDQVRQLSQDDVKILAAKARYIPAEVQIEEIRRVYGDGAEQVINSQEPFLRISEQDHRALLQHILSEWPAVQETANTVLPATKLTAALGAVGAPTDWRSLGLTPAMVEFALLYGHYLRDRFTIIKLFRALGLPVVQKSA